MREITPIATWQTPNLVATVSHIEDSENLILTWSDGVANEWGEIHTDMAHALARLAVLAHLAESNKSIGLGFADAGEDFANRVDAFIKESVL